MCREFVSAPRVLRTCPAVLTLHPGEISLSPHHGHLTLTTPWPRFRESAMDQYAGMFSGVYLHPDSVPPTAQECSSLASSVPSRWRTASRSDKDVIRWTIVDHGIRERIRFRSSGATPPPGRGHVVHSQFGTLWLTSLELSVLEWTRRPPEYQRRLEKMHKYIPRDWLKLRGRRRDRLWAGVMSRSMGEGASPERCVQILVGGAFVWITRFEWAVVECLFSHGGRLQ